MSQRRKRTHEDVDDSEPGPSQRERTGSTGSNEDTTGGGEQKEGEGAAGVAENNGDGDNSPRDYSGKSGGSSSTGTLPPPSLLLEEISNNVVIQVLGQYSSLRPFKRSEVLHDTQASKGRLANQVMEEVHRKLAEIYGLTLLEVEHQKYILINPMHKKLERYVNEQKSPKRDLLGLLLTIIFVNNMSVHEDKLRECLQKVKVDFMDNHPYFGDVNKHIQEFEKQMYITKDYIHIKGSGGQGGEKSQPFYAWGIRAKHEISMNSILEVLAKIYDTTPENLPPTLKSIAVRFSEPEPMEEFA